MAMDDLEFEAAALKSLLKLLRDQPTVEAHWARDPLLTSLVALEIEMALTRDAAADALTRVCEDAEWRLAG